MIEPVREKVSVITIYDAKRGSVLPWKIKWRGKLYTIAKLGYYHRRKIGRVILHTFDVTNGAIAFRLICNPENLHWTLEEVSDGSTN